MATRSQSSTEYLVILAAVVIIALAVVGVLTGFPALTRGISAKEALAYWQSADISVEKPYLSSSSTAGTSKVTLRNNQNFVVTVNDIRFGASSVEDSGLPASLNPGESKTIGLAAQVPCTSSGGTYSVIVSINYMDTSNSANYTFTGTRPLTGTCQ